MYLKKIITQGFKSFADNMVIELSQNIAGIVGPNGSGKSNVVDAIRWVLGEQSVKSLRGDDAMVDIIFAGSSSRKPMTVATVTLIFDNADHYLANQEDEVSVKRRLYKDGTNEYFINNEKVRLKDLTALILDSGIGKESFNIIGQGQIDNILSEKATDRRVMFEEAAGVLKYKKRKEEAIRKLDKTHDNMNRVNDIIKELEQQVEPLKEQKIKALKYFDLQDELKDLEISSITNDIKTINEKYTANKEKIEVLKEEITNISLNTNKSEIKIEEYKNNINKLNEEINKKQQELIDIATKVEKINSQKEIITERKKYEVDNVKLHNQVLELKEQQLKISNDISNLNLEINNIKQKYDVLNNNKIKLDEELKKTNDLKRKKELELSNDLRSQSVLNNKINNLRESIQNSNSLPSSVRNVINNPKLKGIHSNLGNLFEVEEKYSKAITTSLGASINNIVVDNEINAKEAISYLKQNNLGRATFYPLNIIKSKEVDTSTLSVIKKCPGFISIASSLVKNNAIYDNIINNQLGNVLVVDNIDNANNISKTINYRYKIVTLDGELLHVGGSITGGNIVTKNVISEKYELEKFLAQAKANESKIQNIENELNEIDYNLKSIEDKIYLANKDLLMSKEELNAKLVNMNELNTKKESIASSISGTLNIINDTLSDEEDRILEDYYKALNEKNEVSNTLNNLKNSLISLTNELEEYEYSSKKENSLYNQKNQELKDLEIEVNRSDVKLDNLLNQLSETYNMTYEYATSHYKLEMDVALVKNKISTIKHQMKLLEPINATAPEEYDRVSERYEFLIGQQEDLLKAENTLLEIIKEMDEVMETNFMKTFDIINKNFAITFRELFKGGRATLKLSDPSNILETGIEIEACPPGKSLKSISLLSGGEKTFTAISLLFAILKSRPVPFCILDEVEAALDEANVESFGEYLQGLKGKTQFIVITHKKKTMEYADILYGITMQESGVSKLVSVRLEDIK